MDKLENLIKYKFKNKKLLKQALTHKSAKTTKNNEKLEFLGDAVLDLIVGEYLFVKFKDMNEGDLSKTRASLVNEKSFANIANSINLGDFLILSASEENNGGRLKPSLLSDALEAIIGAIYLESGLERARSVFVDLLERQYYNIDIKSLFKDYKTALQEITQSNFALTPKYELILATGPDHNKTFEMAVFLGENELARSIGASKKEAEQKAAKMAIERLKKGVK